MDEVTKHIKEFFAHNQLSILWLSILAVCDGIICVHDETIYFGKAFKCHWTVSASFVNTCITNNLFLRKIFIAQELSRLKESLRIKKANIEAELGVDSEMEQNKIKARENW